MLDRNTLFDVRGSMYKVIRIRDNGEINAWGPIHNNMDTTMTAPGVAERRLAGFGTLEELFQEGTQGVFESLSIVLVEADLTTTSVYVPYIRHAGNTVEWLPVQYPPEWVATKGRVPRLLRATVRYSQGERARR